MPGRETEYVCSTPSISASTCSIGTATTFSTSTALAPGNGTNTFANVTSICGSSSRGVISTAKSPSSSPAIARSGVIFESWKRRATRPEKPSRPAGRPAPRAPFALVIVMSPPPRSLAFREAVPLLDVDPGGDRIERDELALIEPREHLDVFPVRPAEAHLPQRRAPLVHHVDRGQLASPHHGLRRHEQAPAFADDEADLHEHAGKEAHAVLGQVHPHAESVRGRIRDRIERHALGRDALVPDVHERTPDLADRLEHALRHVDVHAQRPERQAAHQRLTGRDELADLDVTLGDDARIRSADDRILELLLRARDRRAGRLEPGRGRLAIRLRLLE